ncbi:MAG: ATP-binding cassette domain-containing protein [Opitutaceae bacterium]|jgi:ABC-type branched-subunit amino acid transport system ATPase component
MNNTNQSGAGAPLAAAPRSRVLLRATHLQKSFGGQKVLNGVSLEVREGEVILLKGDNGSGKTTLLNILTGCLEPDSGTIEYAVDTKPELFKFPRRWWQEANPFDHFVPERAVWEGICRTWQDGRLFPSQSLADNIAVAQPNQMGEQPANVLFRYPTVRKEEKLNLNLANDLISTYGLESVETESGDRISFGYAKRIALARSTRTGAKVLFLDEPLAGLDDSSIRKVVQSLAALARDEGLTLVIVEHAFNIPLIMEMASTVWTLVRGELVSAETQGRSIGMGSDTNLDELLRGISVGPWQVKDMPLYGGGIIKKALPGGTTGGVAVLEIEDLVVYRGNRMIVGHQKADGRIEGLSFDVRAGELAFLLAPNGWGKTTLLEAIAGMIKLTRGTVKLNGREIGDLPLWERARSGLSMVQSRNHSFPSLSVEESLLLSGLAIPEDQLRHRMKKMGSLSGGEKKQVALAQSRRAFVKFSLLDEPFEGLDQTAYQRCLSELRPQANGGVLTALPSAISFEQRPQFGGIKS